MQEETQQKRQPLVHNRAVELHCGQGPGLSTAGVLWLWEFTGKIASGNLEQYQASKITSVLLEKPLGSVYSPS